MGDWRDDERLIAVATAIRAECGHPPREAVHWRNMWDEWGEEGDRWIRMARASLDAVGLGHG